MDQRPGRPVTGYVVTYVLQKKTTSANYFAKETVCLPTVLSMSRVISRGSVDKTKNGTILKEKKR